MIRLKIFIYKSSFRNGKQLSASNERYPNEGLDLNWAIKWRAGLPKFFFV